MFKRETTEAQQELRNARAHLENVSKGQREETPAITAANQRVAAAEKNVPWRQR